MQSKKSRLGIRNYSNLTRLILKSGGFLFRKKSKRHIILFTVSSQIPSMYGIFYRLFVYHKNQPNSWIGKYTVRPMDGIWMFLKIMVPPKSSILIVFSIINHPFWGPTPIFGNTHMGLTKKNGQTSSKKGSRWGRKDAPDLWAAGVLGG